MSGDERRRIYLLKIDDRDEPNPAHVESLGRGETRPEFFKPARWFGAKIVPPRTSHGMSECSGRPLV
jgi:hypothetical protein